MNIINLHDKNLYYIGGIVRDELLNKPCFDIDLTYEGDAIEFAKQIPDAEILQINEPFGTVKIKYEQQTIDIASTRNETYSKKGHLPEVTDIGCSLKEDVLRRDFTINALAKSTLNGEIIDYTGGLEDIKNKKIRVLHEKSFIDDPTRILRALKFRVRFGFDLEENTQKLQKEYLANINYDMSFKRLKKELTETFNLNCEKAFDIFINEGIYKLLSPKKYTFGRVVGFEPLIKKYKPQNIWIIYVGLLPDISNLALTKTEKKIVDDFVLLQNKDFSTDFDIYKNFDGLNIESVIMFYAINPNAVKKYLNILREIKIETTGQDLKSIGIEPSPKYQNYFDIILKEKLKNPNMTKSQELELLKNLR